MSVLLVFGVVCSLLIFSDAFCSTRWRLSPRTSSALAMSPTSGFEKIQDVFNSPLKFSGPVDSVPWCQSPKSCSFDKIQATLKKYRPRGGLPDSDKFVIGHDCIACEMLPYIPRDKVSADICYYFEDRQKDRKIGNPMDKRSNPILVVPGSLGSGKSTFLTNFPDSDAYKEYVRRRGRGETKPIVCLLTFNSGMSFDDSTSLSHRIFYGTLYTQGWIDNTTSFKTFCNSLPPEAHKFSIWDSIMLLRSLFNRSDDCLFLLCVDELSKATGMDKDYLWKLGTALNGDGNLDVIVSSLSPGYIEDLLIGSSRDAVHFILEPLLEVGRDECETWANKVIAYASASWADLTGNPSRKRIENNRIAKITLLRNIYRLYSGHPRSVEEFIDYVNDTVFGADFNHTVIDLLEDDTKGADDLFRNCMEHLEVYTNELTWESNPSEIEEFVFTLNDYYKNDGSFNTALEGGKIMIVREKFWDYICGVPAINVLRLIHDMEENGDIIPDISAKSRAMYEILNDLNYDDEDDDYRHGSAARHDISAGHDSTGLRKLSIWFERLVAANIACGISQGKCKLGSIFGAKKPQFTIGSPKDAVEVSNLFADEDIHIPKTPNNVSTMTIPTRTRVNNPPYDFKIDLKRNISVYVSTMLAMPNKATLASAIAKTVCVAVAEQLGGKQTSIYQLANKKVPKYSNTTKTKLVNLFVFFYIWADLNDEIQKIDKHDVMERIPGCVESLFAGDIRANNFTELVTTFVNEKWDRNVEVIEKKTLEKWLLPSVVAIPSLLSEVTKVINKKKKRRNLMNDDKHSKEKRKIIRKKKHKRRTSVKEEGEERKIG